MINERERYERAFQQFQMPEPAWDRLVGRRDRKRRNQRIAAGVVGIAVFVAAVWGVTSGGWFDRTQTPAAEESTPTVSPTPSPSPEPVVGTLTKEDVYLDPITTEKQCFGSAGCNVMVEVLLSISAEVDAALPHGAWDITYELTGDESGVIIGTLHLSKKNPRVRVTGDKEFLLSTPSSNTRIRIKVTDVEYRP